ncbi:hypothetical protein [Streptomyces sp. NPDC048639]|uniref:hypothetical protein n=1 Tax=Streptomyces sp. NPDC048639 TaxID=3365581 RepID=UPI0037203A71
MLDATRSTRCNFDPSANGRLILALFGLPTFIPADMCPSTRKGDAMDTLDSTGADTVASRSAADRFLMHRLCCTSVRET